MSTKTSPQITASELILPIASAGATLARTGGKGANLASLTLAGFDVPPGFIVTTEAYRAFVSENQIGDQLRALAAASASDDPVALERTSTQIRALFSKGTFPADIEAQGRAAYANLPASDSRYPAVAVRSSATAEDLPGMSFAGQQDTYLNVVGAEALLDSIKACWGSLWTARAMGYRARNHIPPDEVALAVVVQMMIPSEVSGVLFTANPLTGHRGEIVIDASYGLGEAIVSGQVDPDHYVVDQRDMRITSRKLGAKALAILPKQEGGTEHVSAERGGQQALTDEQILDLSRTAKRVADHFGSPQDIEWAWAHGKLYLLQSRPITSLHPVPEALLRSDKLRIFFSFNSVQGVIDPFTPLGQETLRRMVSGILRAAGVHRPVEELMIDAGERLYIDLTDVVTDKRLQRGALGVLANVDPGARQTLIRLIESGRIASHDTVKARALLRLLLGLRAVFAGAALAWLRPEARRARSIRKAEQFVAQMQEAFGNAKTLEARLALLEDLSPNIFLYTIFMTVAPTMIPGLLGQGIVDRWLSSWLGAERGTALRRLLRGVPGNPTTQMDLTLWATAQAIHADPASTVAILNGPAEVVAEAYLRGELPATAQNAIREFVDKYGMRAVAEIDVGRARWREDPRSIIQTLASYLQIEEAGQAPDRLFQSAAAEAEKLAAEYIQQTRQIKGGLRARLLTKAIHVMRTLSGMREMPKFYIVKLLDVVHMALLESGRDLVKAGSLDSAEDIFFTTYGALRKAAQGQQIDLRSIVRQKKADYEHELARRQIPRLLLSTGEVFYAGVSSEGTNDLVGDGVSPGSAEGIVHVVHDPRGVRLQPGEILVCPATDPGWTPLFLSAGGLVMELGGMVTHGSVVAREYGIPAVVGVHEATTRLKTGQRVRVDGSAGRIAVLE